MAVRKKIKFLTSYYLSAQKGRREWSNWKWRLLMVLVVALILTLVYDYLTGKYFYALSYAPAGGAQVVFVLSEKLFAWFVTGMIFGIVMLAFVFEGEFFLGLMKVGRAIEFEAEKGLMHLGKEVRLDAAKEARGFGALAKPKPAPKLKQKTRRRKS